MSDVITSTSSYKKAVLSMRTPSVELTIRSRKFNSQTPDPRSSILLTDGDLSNFTVYIASTHTTYWLTWYLSGAGLLPLLRYRNFHPELYLRRNGRIKISSSLGLKISRGDNG